MLDRRRTLPLLVLPLAAALLLFGAAPSSAQLFPWPTTTTTTTPPTTTTTAPAPPATEPTPSTTPPPSPPSTPPAPAPEPPAPEAPAPPPGGGDGGTTTFAGRTIPPDAQRVIDSIQRTPANNSQALYDAVIAHLVPLGLSEEEAIRVGFGRFPIAGVANYVHDWYYPRWGPGIRFHEGTDVFAAHGTPVRSPVDGTATSGNGSLGGLWVKVHQADGSYFYLAHLSGFVEGFHEGMPVRTGDIVGYVGDTGNARGGAPHVHLGLYTGPGQPTDPKPVLDQMLAEAMEALPGIVEQVRADAPAAPAAETPEPAARVPRSLLASSLLRPVVDDRISAGLDAAALLEAVGNPTSGGLAIAEAQAHRLASDIDWEARAQRRRGPDTILGQTGRLVRDVLSAPGR